MEKSYEAKYHKLENENWWFVARRNMIINLIENNQTKKNCKILEIGCSGGPLIIELQDLKFINIFGIDISESAISICKNNGLKNVFVMNAAKTNFQPEEFDLIIASDILEHIENDTNAILEWKRILKKNGKMIIFVPAFHFLWSSHDIANHHFRRYSKFALKKLLVENGLKIHRVSYWNFFVFFPVAILRIFQWIFHLNQKNSNQLIELNPFINKLLVFLLKFENKLLSLVNFPFGVSVFTIVEK